MARIFAALFLFMFLSTPADAEPELSKVIKTTGQSAQKSAAVQEEVGAVDDESDALLRKFRDENRRIEDLRLYNRQLELRIKDQLSLIEQLKKLGRDAVEFEKRIPPLLLRMIESLEQFAALDIPFRPEERAKRIDSLKKLMARGDVSIAGQFRRVFDAYLEEIDYGGTIGAYAGTVEIEGETRRVTFLRIGRIALLYQTDDLSSVGMWNPEEKKWERLGGEYKDPVRKGIAIAREQAAPNLLFVPVRAPAGEGKE
ncbi:DUF3450 domain-containing protein [Candidatus Mycalebacterium sp.]